MSRKVTYARVHQEIFIGGGVGQLGTSLPPANKTFPSGFHMTWNDQGLTCKVNGTEFIIPTANCVFAVFAPEETPAPKALKSA